VQQFLVGVSRFLTIPLGERVGVFSVFALSLGERAGVFLLFALALGERVAIPQSRESRVRGHVPSV